MSEIEYLKQSINNIHALGDILTKLPTDIVFILDARFRIVYENTNLLEELNITPNNNNKGVGDAFLCINAANSDEGCGSTEWCKYCGVYNSIRQSLKSGASINASANLLTLDSKNEQRDLEVTSTPLQLGKENYFAINIKDVSDKKRRQSLERTFFHDIINLAGSLDGIIESMDEMTPDEIIKFQKIAKRLSNELVDEILAQDELVKAETNILVPEIREYKLNEILELVTESIQFHQVAKNKNIRLENKLPVDFLILTDKKLLNRVLINMCKNAIEASDLNDTVTLLAELEENNLKISVHNNAYISREIQRQLFHRSFSTKGKGRGIGTYSMKLIGEKYLNGKISFTSNKQNGTTFIFSISN